jgi:hypothetical protein
LEAAVNDLKSNGRGSERVKQKKKQRTSVQEVATLEAASVPVEEAILIGRAKDSAPPVWACDVIHPAAENLRFACLSFGSAKSFLTAPLEVTQDVMRSHAQGKSILTTRIKVTHDASGALLTKSVVIYGPSFSASKRAKLAEATPTLKLRAACLLFRVYVSLVRNLRLDAVSKGVLSSTYPGSSFDEKPQWVDFTPRHEDFPLPESVFMTADYNIASAAARAEAHLKPSMDVVATLKGALLKGQRIEPRLEGCAFCGEISPEGTHTRSRFASICEIHASCATCRARWAFLVADCTEADDAPPCPCCAAPPAKRTRIA